MVFYSSCFCFIFSPTHGFTKFFYTEFFLIRHFPDISHINFIDFYITSYTNKSSIFYCLFRYIYTIY